MRTISDFLILPRELTDFERRYLARLNRVALAFFAVHVPAFVLIAWRNDTGPGTAALLTLAVLAGPVIAQSSLQNPRSVSVVHGVTAMFMGGLLVHFGQGPVQIEMHFYFFSLVAMCAVFGNPLVIVAAAATVALHHLVVWLVLPRSVFNYDAAWWVVAVHAAFVVLESVAACFISRSFFDNVIGLEKVVQNRTLALDSKNREMRLVLDNVQQGFLTMDRDGNLAAEHSKAVDLWLGAPASGATWFDYLSTCAPQFAEGTRLGWNEVVRDFLPIEMTLDQMPHRLSLSGGRHFQVEYRPIGSAEPFDRFLIIVTDVTSDTERERVEQEAREAIAVFESVLADRGGFETFFEDSKTVVETLGLGRATDLVAVKRMIHTLKGNSSLLGLTSIAKACHELEDLIEDEGTVPSASSTRALQDAWARLSANAARITGERGHTIEIDDPQYAALESAVRAAEPHAVLLRRVKSLKLESAAKRLNHFQEQAKRIATRLDRDVRVEVEDRGVRLDARRWAAFWANFVHAVRNAIDHGLETADVRRAAGKPAEGTLALRTYEENGRVYVEIADDGKGIDWNAVAERALTLGLPAQTPADLHRALFADGLSTAASITELSGRGVGMGALLEGTRALGGELFVQSAPGQGTTLRFAFPVSATTADTVPPRSMSTAASEQVAVGG